MKWLTLNNVLKAIATVVGVAGLVVAAPTAIVPVAVGAIALKVVTYGTLAGLAAAKILPGHGDNAPAPKP